MTRDRDSAPVPPALTGAALTRARILDAAAQLMSTTGLARTTTKELAREAGCSEATLYKHFRDKEEIFLHVLSERLPSLPSALARLHDRVGQGDPAAHLAEIARIAVSFYERTFPIAASLFAGPELLAAHRVRLAEEHAGPNEPLRALASYLQAEKAAGRIAPDVDPAAGASLLLGACFQRAFLRLFYGQAWPDTTLHQPDDEQFAAGIVHLLSTGARLSGS